MTHDISGDWHGVLNNGSVKVKLGFRLDGATAWLNTRTEGVVALPLTVLGGRLAFEAERFNIALDLTPVAGRLEGTCCQSGIAFPVTFERGLAPAVGRCSNNAGRCRFSRFCAFVSRRSSATRPPAT